MATLSVFRDQNNPREWRWHRHSGGNLTADSGEGYVNKDHAVSMAEEIADPGDTIRILDDGKTAEYTYQE